MRAYLQASTCQVKAEATPALRFPGHWDGTPPSAAAGMARRPLCADEKGRASDGKGHDYCARPERGAAVRWRRPVTNRRGTASRTSLRT